MPTAAWLDRRDFLKRTAAGTSGLVIGWGKYETLADLPPKDSTPINAWVQIAPNDSVTLLIDKSEMGQGVSTTLAMILADELDLDWKRVQTEFASAAPQYFNPIFGLQGTGGGCSVRGSWEPLAKAGAAAREMLVATAAKRWSDASACRAENSAVETATGKRLGYGAFAEEAANLPVPVNPQPKDPKDYKYVGKPSPRIDSLEKSNAKAQFGIDVRLPGMLYAVVARCPVFGGTAKDFDAAKTKAVWCPATSGAP